MIVRSYIRAIVKCVVSQIPDRGTVDLLIRNKISAGEPWIHALVYYLRRLVTPLIEPILTGVAII